MVDPIHFQDLFSKTEMLEKIDQVQKHHSEVMNRQAAEEMQNKIQQDLNQTQQMQPKDEAILHHEEKNQEKQDQKEKKKNSENDDQSEEKSSKNPDDELKKVSKTPHKIDITI